MPAQHSFIPFLNPKSIAIIGASRSKDKVGYQVLENLIEGNYPGHLYPVNPNADSILKLKCFPTVSDIKKPVDLAIIITPAALVSPIIAECHENNIKHAIVISAGFAESGPKGSILQQELTHTLNQYPVSILGPNCLGVLSPIHHLNATFGPRLPQKGNVMLISQSGALVTGIIDWAQMMNIGLSHAITFGNRINTGEIEALQYAASDPHTKVILLYLESFANAHQLFSLCSQITPKKPIIFLKGGQSLAGQSASASHTAALASNYTLTKALAQQAGCIVANTIEEWLNLAAAFTVTPPAKHNDLTIVTNAGGPGVLSTDEASALNLDISNLSSVVKQKLHTALPQVSTHNPLDILGDASPEDFKATLTILKNDKHNGSLLIIITPQTTTKPRQTAEAIVSSGIHKVRPTYVVLIGGEKMSQAKKVLDDHQLLNFEFPTPALHIIAAKSRYELNRDSIPQFPARKQNYLNKNTIAKISKQITDPIDLATGFSLLQQYKLNLPKSAIVDTLEEVPKAIDLVGKPAVIKTAGLRIAHKAAVGGVALNVMTASQARMVFRKLQTLHPSVLFQQTIHGELELIIGTKVDSQFGPFITVGLGGGLTNTIADRAYAFVPATKTTLINMFKETKAYQAIIKKKLPVEPVIDLIEKVSSMLVDFPQIAELEINPAILTKKKIYIADIKIVPNDTHSEKH